MIMKKILFLLLIQTTFVFTAFSQYASVNFDATKNYFNDGQFIPAEKNLMFSGVVPEGVEMVEISILSSKGNRNLYTSVWKGKEATTFALPLNYKLKSSDKYDFQLDYFVPINAEQQKKLKANINANIMAYLEAHLTGKKSIKLEKKARKVIDDLNGIVAQSMENYRTTALAISETFSIAVEQKLNNLENADLLATQIKNDSTSKQEVRNDQRQQLIGELENMIKTEIEQMTDQEFLLLNDSRYVDNYETDGKQSTLSINAGYGGVYLSGKFNEDFTYDAAPYVGLSIPLGNSTFAPKILSNASLSLGVFLENFENENGDEVTGLIFNRPLYLGLDYKLFQFVRLNAGATLLEEDRILNETGDTETKVLIRPFIGLGATINLNFGIEK